MILDDLTALPRLDPHDARSVLAAFPEQCRAAMRLRAEPAISVKRPGLVVVAGMGGSAVGGDLLAACAADRLEVPVMVHRGYGLPAAVTDESLVLACSYSGDTAEVLSAVEAAAARGTAPVAITAGGALAARATDEGWPLVRLPGGLMPRMALGYLFLPCLELMRAAGRATAGADEIAEVVTVVEAMRRELEPECPAADNEAKALALAFHGRLPAVYGGPGTGAAAYRWKTDIEENAKTFALSGVLPEMNHNEIEAWNGPEARRMQLVLLRDTEEPPEIALRFALLREIASPAAGGISEIHPRGVGRVARMLSLVYLGQWTSYYLAILRGVDPWEVPCLDALKRRMRGERARLGAGADAC
jgi:glucose/mannose-6-phosphate isomerase